jgi:hypothetical protein
MVHSSRCNEQERAYLIAVQQPDTYGQDRDREFWLCTALPLYQPMSPTCKIAITIVTSSTLPLRVPNSFFDLLLRYYPSILSTHFILFVSSSQLVLHRILAHHPSALVHADRSWLLIPILFVNLIYAFHSLLFSMHVILHSFSHML